MSRPITPGAPLSSQETLVVSLVAEGLSNAEIGRELFVSEDTVKTHLRRSFRKLGAKGRAHAVSIALRGELVSARRDLVCAAQIVQVRRVLASFYSTRADAPDGSRFALFYDQLAATLKAED